MYENDRVRVGIIFSSLTMETSKIKDKILTLHTVMNKILTRDGRQKMQIF